MSGSNRRVVTVEVKSTKKKVVTRFYQDSPAARLSPPDFWVVYSVQAQGDDFVGNLYVLSHREMAEEQAKVNWGNMAPPDEDRFFKNGVDNISLAQLERQKTGGARSSTSATVPSQADAQHSPSAARTAVN